MLENGFTLDGSGPGALALLSAQLFPRFHGQHAMTVIPSTMHFNLAVTLPAALLVGYLFVWGDASS